MSDIWQGCQGSEHIRLLRTTATRLVESQEQVATTVLVDSLAEQRVLEDLLEHSKPPVPSGSEGYHYLIWTPFRYPPLPYGSRFGGRSHRGIFYASLTLATALAECAYYRFVFLSGLDEPLPTERLTTAHISFEVQIDTAHGVALNAAPFNRYRTEISSPTDYTASQQLGAAIRDAGVEAFTYCSARDPAKAGINLGALTLRAIRNRRPRRRRQWICITTENEVAFIEAQTKSGQPHNFPYRKFLVNDQLPVPSC